MNLESLEINTQTKPTSACANLTERLPDWTEMLLHDLKARHGRSETDNESSEIYQIVQGKYLRGCVSFDKLTVYCYARCVDARVHQLPK